MKKLTRFASLFALVGILAGCGGGGGGGGGNTVPGSGGSLALSPTSLSFSATQNDLLPSAQIILASFTEPDTAVIVVGYPPDTVEPTWLALSVVGNFSPIQISARPNTTALQPGTYAATVRVITARADQTIISLRDVPVSYTVSAFQPLLQGSYVVPYIATANIAGNVVIRGPGLSGVTTVSFGGIPGTNVSVISGTEVHASYPALPAGSYAVTLNSGAVRFSANLVVVNAPTYVDESIAYPVVGAPLFRQVRTLVYDAERNIVFVGLNDAADPMYGVLLGYAYNGGWQMPMSTSIPQLRDLAMSLDGTKLFALARPTIRSVDPRTLVQGVPVDVLGPLPDFKNLAIANDGNAVVTTGEGGAGLSTLYVYGTGSSAFLRVPFSVFPGFNGVDGGTPVASGDGSRVVVIQGGSNLINDRPVYQYRGSTGTLSNTGLPLNQSNDVTMPIVRPAVDRTATRIVLRGNRVYDQNYTFLGTLPSTTSAVVLRPDGTRAYTFDSSGRVRTFDITGNPGGGAFIELAPAGGILPPAAPGVVVQMTITPDGGNLFLAGGDNLVVMTAP